MAHSYLDVPHAVDLASIDWGGSQSDWCLLSRPGLCVLSVSLLSVTRYTATAVNANMLQIAPASTKGDRVRVVDFVQDVFV